MSKKVIYLEDAIVAVNIGAFSARTIYGRTDEGSTALHETVRAIKALPPAEPEITYCRDCKHRVVNEHYGEKGYLKLKAYCDLDTGDIFELGRCAEKDDWYCADAERIGETNE